MSAAPTRERSVREGVVALARRFRTHGGGVELVESRDEGREVIVRMTGFCRGCPYKAPCVEHTLRPALEAAGAREVHVQGYAISDESRARLLVAFGQVAP